MSKQANKETITGFWVIRAFCVAVFFGLLILWGQLTPGQSATELFRRCAGAAPSPTRALVEVQKDGDVNIVPCAGRSIFINGGTTAGLITSLNGLTASTQLFAIGTTGTDFNIVSGTATHTFNFPTASSANRGLLSSANWTTFNNKLGSLNGLTASTQLFAIGAADTAAFSSVTATHTLNLPITAVSGSSRTTFFPYFDAQNTLATSPFSWNGTTFTFDNSSGPLATFNMATGVFTFGNNPTSAQIQLNATANTFTALATSGITFDTRSSGFTFGDSTAAVNGSKVSLTDSTKTFLFDATNNLTNFTVRTGRADIGDCSTRVNGTCLTVRDSTNVFTFANTAGNGVMGLVGIGNFLMNRTMTAAGTTGAQTINKPSFQVNFAAAAATLVVTNSNVNTTSGIICQVLTADATMFSVQAVRGAGTLTLTARPAVPTAETAVYCEVKN